MHLRDSFYTQAGKRQTQVRPFSFVARIDTSRRFFIWNWKFSRDAEKLETLTPEIMICSFWASSANKTHRKPILSVQLLFARRSRTKVSSILHFPDSQLLIGNINNCKIGTFHNQATLLVRERSRVQISPAAPFCRHCVKLPPKTLNGNEYLVSNTPFATVIRKVNTPFQAPFSASLPCKTAINCRIVQFQVMPAASCNAIAGSVTARKSPYLRDNKNSTFAKSKTVSVFFR